MSGSNGPRSRGAGIQGSALEDLAFGGSDVDPRTAASRLGGFLFVASGLVVGLTLWLPQPLAVNRVSLLFLGIAAVAIGLVMPELPWDRWPRQAFLVPVALAFAMLAAGNLEFRGTLNPYHATYVVTFLFIGLTQPPGTSLKMLPVAVASYLLPALDSSAGVAITGIAIAAPIWLITGEVTSWSERRTRRAEDAAGTLLGGVRTLARADDEHDVARAIASMVDDLLAPDCLIVFIDNGGDGKLSPALPVRCEAHESIDLKTTILDVRNLAAGRTASAGGEDVPGFDASLSLVLIPMAAAGTLLGLVAVAWPRGRRRFDNISRRTSDVVNEEGSGALLRIRSSRRLAEEAETDELTRLPNRRTYTRALDCIAPGDAVVIVDLDHFKRVNDHHGHATGDEVLRSLAECMRKIARRSDCIARYGGEEFAMVLAGANESGAVAALERLRLLWSATNPLTTFSGGIAVYADGEDAVATLERADQALYRAKAEGRNRIIVAPPPVTEPAAAP
jgi:diguanylate cyclase (GGDEF)-like protein